ncbi:MAG: hypothetical protein PHH77_05975 [Victivallaceae bacterium]|nr:hypothetical protein [Victivallaceae bacterium]
MDKLPIEYIVTLVVGCVLTWLVFILALAKFSKLCSQFGKFRQAVETDLTGVGTNIRKMQLSIQEMTVEQRRTNKLLVELIEAQKNANPLSGLEYELVEEEEIIPK